MRALVVSNMRPDAAHPERGQFVRDQVAALAEIDGIEVHLRELAPGARALAKGFAQLRREAGARERYDVVHAHFSLSAVPALAVPAAVRALTLHGTDVRHPRTRKITRAVLPLMDVVLAVSDSLACELPGRSARSRAQVIPCGVSLKRFTAMPRARARAALGLPPDEPLLLFPADPARPEKRHDRALLLARAAGARLITLGGVAPDRVPLMVNAVNAVLVPSENEGFGLAVLEALACEVPVLATPVGGHPHALADIDGALCAPFDPQRWLQSLRPHLRPDAPRLLGARERAAELSAERMAERVAAAWRAALER